MEKEMNLTHNPYHNHAFSFSKANRFPKLRLASHFQQRHHSQPSKKEETKLIVSTIPRAARTFFSKSERSICLYPSPQDYDFKLCDQIGKVTHIGNTLGVRLSNSTKQITPGPLHYLISGFSCKKTFNKTFTFKRQKRNIDSFMNNTGRDSPGPMYNTQVSLKKAPSKQKIKLQNQKRDKLHKKKMDFKAKRQKLQTKFLERENNFLKSGHQELKTINNVVQYQNTSIKTILYKRQALQKKFILITNDI